MCCVITCSKWCHLLYGAQSCVNMGLSTVQCVVSSLAASDVICCMVHSPVLTWDSVLYNVLCHHLLCSNAATSKLVHSVPRLHIWLDVLYMQSLCSSIRSVLCVLSNKNSSVPSVIPDFILLNMPLLFCLPGTFYYWAESSGSGLSHKTPSITLWF